MNSLTVNLHLLLISFYRPTSDRHKVLIEDHAFPSDHFAVESQIRQRGFDPETSLVTVSPREGEEILRPEDILAAIAEHGDELSVVLLPGVQYYTGQVLPMADIVAAGHDVGAVVGFDLAHAIGNIQLDLHDWGLRGLVLLQVPQQRPRGRGRGIRPPGPCRRPATSKAPRLVGDRPVDPV